MQNILELSSGQTRVPKLKFKNNCFTEMCSGSETGSYLRLVDFVYHSSLGSRVTKKRRRRCPGEDPHRERECTAATREGGDRVHDEEPVGLW